MLLKLYCEQGFGNAYKGLFSIFCFSNCKISYQKTLATLVCVADPFSGNPDPDTGFYWIWIRIQVCWGPRIVISFKGLPRGLQSHIHAKSQTLQGERPALQSLKYRYFIFFVGHFWLPRFRFTCRIRIQSYSRDPIKSGSSLHPDHCWGFLTFWCGSGSPDPYLCLMDPDPDLTPDPTSSFSDFKDAKN
jgi:hypothetical protein